MGRTTILILDAEVLTADAVREAFADADVRVVAETRAFSPREAVRTHAPGIVIADRSLLGDDPSRWIHEALGDRPSLVAIVLKGAREGGDSRPIPEAFDLLDRPLSRAALRRAGGRALDHHRLLERLEDLGGAAPGRTIDPGRSAADRRFREAKRTVVDAFEQAYLEDLLRRHGGNVTAAASHSGMLRSALQRLLRKHDLRSSAFREGRSGERDRTV